MPSRVFSCIASAACLLGAVVTMSAQSVEAIHARFVNPPADARPMVRWWWFGPAVTKEEIRRELEQMKADAIGGAELAFVYPLALDDANIHNLKFVSPEMLAMVTYAQATARELGLRADVTLCSGWPYGGPHISLAQAATRLRTVEVAIPAGATSVDIPKPQAEGDSLFSLAVVHGEPKAWTAEGAKTLPLPTQTGPVSVGTSQGSRVALFFFLSHTRQQVKRAAVGAEGYVLDPFSKDAVATHLKAVGEPLVSAFGKTPPYAIFSDSLEAYGADWTPRLPEEFRKRRGYDLIPHLPELVSGQGAASERVRHDYGVTLTELVNENYLEQINAWAKAHGTRFRSQTYGEPAVSFSSQDLVALAEGEGSQWRQFSTLRWASSANHVFGHNITSGETFTWLHSPVFRATPLDMKAEADVDFVSGENLLIFHGWPYSPPASELPAGDPGWSLYASGAFNDHNPWHPAMPTVTKYIARISQLTREGQPANQVAVLLPTDDAWAKFLPGKVSVTALMKELITPELMDTILAAGYNVDFIDAAAIAKTGFGTHTIVVLPPTDRIPTETLRALDAFANGKGHVIAFGKLPSLDAKGAPISPPRFPLARTATELTDKLHAAEHPDLEVESTEASHVVGFLHRSLRDADIFFIANTSNHAVDTALRFRTQFAKGERWDTDTAAIVHSIEAAGTHVSLAPYESAVFVFSGHYSSTPAHADAVTRAIADISDHWQVSFPALKKSFREDRLQDWTSNPATLHYSGEATYSRTFELQDLPKGAVWLAVDGGTAVSPEAPAVVPASGSPMGKDGLPNPLITRTGPGMRAWFDPPVREAATVAINGEAAGTLWHPPYRLDISRLLHRGTNRIEIKVYNTAMNAWSAAPKRNYAPLKAVYGDRFQMQDLDKVAPIPSGILGKIELVSGGAQ